jgi:multidrug efflux pump subunit AcrB
LDTTQSVREGIKEILHTLVEALVLVIIVVFIFLQGWRATLIPALAVPVSLFRSLINIYKAMGGGWIEAAEAAPTPQPVMKAGFIP